MSTTKSNRRRRLPAAERRKQIAQTALELIAERGVGNLTAVVLADRLGLSDAALFRHFDGMADIVDAAVDVFEAALMEGFPPNASDPLERLRLFFMQRTSLVRGAPHILKLAFDDRLVQSVGQKSARRIRRVVKRSQRFILDCIEQAQVGGLVAADIPSPVFMWLVIGVVRGAVSPSVAGGGQSGEELWQSIDKLLRRSVLHL